MGGINSLSGLNKVNVDFRPAIETNVTKTDDANRPQPATDSLPDEAQPPAKTDIGRIVRQLDVLLLNAAGNSVSADGVNGPAASAGSPRYALDRAAELPVEPGDAGQNV